MGLDVKLDTNGLAPQVTVGLIEQGLVDYLAIRLTLALALLRNNGMALLVALKGLEQAMGRVQRERWGPREIDLDLLLFGAAEIRVEREAAARSVDPDKVGVQWLEVPHASAAERAFVLAPLADLAPELVPPGWPETVEEARARAAAAEGPG